MLNGQTTQLQHQLLVEEVQVDEVEDEVDHLKKIQQIILVQT
jgi:hypothetical protein